MVYRTFHDLLMSEARPFEYVRSLWHDYGLDVTTKYRMRDLAQHSGRYLPALRNLRRLRFSNIVIEHINEESFRVCFSAFRETLTCLFLDIFTTSFSAFVTLVDYFPNLTTLRLHRFQLEPEEGPAPSLSRPFRGKLHVHAQAGSLELLNRLAKLNPQYEELEIDHSFAVTLHTPFLEAALQINPGTVKILRLTTDLFGE